jgi:hypothetical protein
MTGEQGSEPHVEVDVAIAVDIFHEAAVCGAHDHWMWVVRLETGGHSEG